MSIINVYCSGLNYEPQRQIKFQFAHSNLKNCFVTFYSYKYENLFGSKIQNHIWILRELSEIKIRLTIIHIEMIRK